MTTTQIIVALIVILISVALAWYCCGARFIQAEQPEKGGEKMSAVDAAYGKPVDYVKMHMISFPDFTIEFLGTEKEVPSYNKMLLFVYYIFKIRGSAEEKIIKWSSGSGEIAPEGFEISGKLFTLELKATEETGWLGENELVVKKK